MKEYYLHLMGIQTWVRRDINKLAPSLTSSETTSGGLSSKSSNVADSVDSTDKPADMNPEPFSSLSKVLLIAIENCEIDTKTRWLCGKQGDLLKNILHSIGLTQNDVALVSIDDSENDLLNSINSPMKPKAILYMGSRIFELNQDAQQGISIIATPHPVDLLKNPISKKNIFINLARFIPCI